MSQTLPPVVRPGPDQTDYDALADLFLGEEPARPPTPTAKPTQLSRPALAAPSPRPATERPHVEGLVLGHLPVMASAWVQQYARHASMQRGEPVALLRLRPGEAQLDLVGAAPARTYATLEEAIRGAGAAAWIVRVDEVTEARLTELPQVSAVTLLTGVDEAAIVSAYRTLKNLFRPGQLADDVEGPAVRIALMGATPEKACEASERLQGAARAFLGRPIQIDACISRIGGRPSAVLFRGAWTGTVDQLLRTLHEPISEPSPQTAELPPAEPVPPPPPPVEVVSRLGRVPSAPVVPAPVAAASLASHIPGLRSAGIPCPYAPQVELAVDERGGMHALGRLESVEVAHLLTAAAWMQSHAQLLRMALRCPESSESPVLHLFTADARKARPLADTLVRMHLLARVETGGHNTSFCTPLN